MVLPIGDAPNPRGVPAVTWLLIAANVAVYVLVSLPLGATPPDPRDPLLHEYVRVMTQAIGDPRAAREALQHVSAYDLFVFSWGFRPAAPSLEDLLVSMFLHGGLLHLAGNMLFLWIYGDNVEHRLGGVRFLAAYLGTGAAATAFHAVGDPSSQIPMVGASGAISGVLGLYFVWFPRNHVRLLWLLPPFIMQVLEVPARLVLGIYLVLDNLLPYFLVSGSGGVAHGAHIGGFVAGLVAGWVLDRRAARVRPPEYAESRQALRAEPRDLGRRIAEAIDAGRPDQAARDYFALPATATRGILSPDHSIALAEWLRANGHPEAAVAVARRHLRDFPRGPGRAEAHLVAGEVLLDVGQPTAAYQHLLDALEADPAPEVAARARAGIAAVEALQKRRVGRLRRAGEA